VNLTRSAVATSVLLPAACALFCAPSFAVAPGSPPAEGPPGASNVPMHNRMEGPNGQVLQLNAVRALQALPPPGVNIAREVTPGTGALTAETMATQPKPEGFAYAIVRDAICDDLSETLLYVKASKDAKTTTAVPVPKDRALLAQCLAGGEVGDLVRGTIVTVRYDPKGVVRPEIIITEVPKIEILDDAKIADRAGSKLFVVTGDKQTRAFSIEGGAQAWASVVQNGKAEDLTPGTLVRIEYDPSGREGIKITLKSPPTQAAPAEDKGCGCSVYGGKRALPWSSLLFGLAIIALLLSRRSRHNP
jgi:MYXO-CTERM domain-containing protein